MIRCMLLVSRQGKVRLAKWYSAYDKKQQQLMIREICGKVLKRKQKLCNFLDYKDGKIIYKRYASLFFITFVDASDNELLHLQTIHHFVEALDSYFLNVCELDLIFNFHRAYYLLDELLLAGEVQETSQKKMLVALLTQDTMSSPEYEQDPQKQLALLQQHFQRSNLV